MPQVARERHGPCSLLPRRLCLQAREAFHLPQQQTSPGLSVVEVGYDMARPVPALRLIAKAGVIAPYFGGRSPDRALQQISDLVLQDLVGRKPDCVAGTLSFEELVYLGIGEGCVTPEIQMFHDASVTSNHRLQQRAPAVGTMD